MLRIVKKFLSGLGGDPASADMENFRRNFGRQGGFNWPLPLAIPDLAHVWYKLNAKFSIKLYCNVWIWDFHSKILCFWINGIN